MQDSQKIDRKALCEVVADKLELMILGESDSISEKFPSEQNLAETFGVSRPVVREALMILKERGLIASRQGAATVICNEGMIEQFSRAIGRIARMKNVTYEQIYQIRVSLETLAVRLAAASTTEKDITTLRALNLSLIRYSDQPKRAATTDVEFHLEIARMSQNPLLLTMERALFEMLLPVLEALLPETAVSGIIWHDKLITAIASKDEDGAADLMRAHLALSRRNCELLAQKNGALL